MKPEDISRARSLLRRKRYSDLIRKLEPAIFNYREDAEFYYLIGLACLHSGDIGGAHSYISRCLQLEPDHVEALLAMAVVDLKRGEGSEALACWLQILEIAPTNHLAKRGLNVARRATHGDSVQQRLRKKGIQWLLPHQKMPVRLLLGRIALATAAVLLLCGAALLIVQWVQRPRITRGGSEHLLFAAEAEQLVDYSGNFRYILTEQEIRAALRQIGELFHDQRDNLAQREVNRLLNSNAGMEVKQRVSLLSEYLARPDFTDFRDNFTYAEIIAEPWLYNGCYVRWNGRIANLAEGLDGEPLQFDLLVGYETEQRLDGIISIIVRFDTTLANGMAIEIIGRVDADAPPLRVEVGSIRPILP